MRCFQKKKQRQKPKCIWTEVIDCIALQNWSDKISNSSQFHFRTLSYISKIRCVSFVQLTCSSYMFNWLNHPSDQQTNIFISVDKCEVNVMHSLDDSCWFKKQTKNNETYTQPFIPHMLIEWLKTAAYFQFLSNIFACSRQSDGKLLPYVQILCQTSIECIVYGPRMWIARFGHAMPFLNCMIRRYYVICINLNYSIQYTIILIHSFAQKFLISYMYIHTRNGCSIYINNSTTSNILNSQF